MLLSDYSKLIPLNKIILLTGTHASQRTTSDLRISKHTYKLLVSYLIIHNAVVVVHASFHRFSFVSYFMHFFYSISRKFFYYFLIISHGFYIFLFLLSLTLYKTKAKYTRPFHLMNFCEGQLRLTHLRVQV